MDRINQTKVYHPQITTNGQDRSLSLSQKTPQRNQAFLRGTFNRAIIRFIDSSLSFIFNSAILDSGGAREGQQQEEGGRV